MGLDMIVVRNVALLCLPLLFGVFIACGEGDPTPETSAVPKVENYSGCEGLEDLIPKLALPGSVTISYYQVVQLGINDTCDNLIKKLNKPKNLKHHEMEQPSFFRRTEKTKGRY